MVEAAAQIRTVKGGMLVVPVYATTLFVSSMLLFLIQPMVGKMILPLLGGTPAVWNACLVFFQATLLAGYAYAHTIAARFDIRRQIMIHFILLALPLLILPIDIAKGSAPPTDANPTFWLLERLLLSVGLPFFVVSTSAPLLQKWVAGMDHPAAKDPYFLYATSNFGSLLALLGYPLLIELSFPVADQSRIWTVGYVVLIMMILLCAIMVWRSADGRWPMADGGLKETRESANPQFGIQIPEAESSSINPQSAIRNPQSHQRLRWIFLALVPSSLMLGVTTHITTNLAPVPLLWVIPLAIYLLTFILVFARKPPVAHSTMARLLPFIFLPLAPLAVTDFFKVLWLLIPAHLLMFFVAAMLCHGELARSRPATQHLTEFYLWMSVGGVLGGIFNAIIAPLVFKTVAEYSLGLVLACLCLPSALDCGRRKAEGESERKSKIEDRGSRIALQARAPLRSSIFHLRSSIFNPRLDIGLPLALGLLALGAVWGVQINELKGRVPVLILLLLLLTTLCFAFKRRPLRFGLTFGVILLTVIHYPGPQLSRTLHVERNFFGVKEILDDPTERLHKFCHGNTIHGIQSTDPTYSREPSAYYHRTGPIGDVFSAFSGPNAKAQIAIVGLGVGSMASYAEPGQHFTFYEIDPAVARIATNPEYFSFLSQCRGTSDVVLGDGRLNLAKAPNHYYGLIILDVFSSDAIPTHFLSKEALKLYLAKLESGGALVFHTSNRYLNLAPVLSDLAFEEGLVCLCRVDRRISKDEQAIGKLPAQYVVMARRPEEVSKLASNPNWKVLSGRTGMALWTDQYSNLFSLFLLRY